MAKATGHICDRCSAKISEGKIVIKLRLEYPAPSDEWTQLKDLCGACVEEFKRFMNRTQKLACKHGAKPVDMCTHHIPCAGPCETIWR